jgi:hypothetical protein
MIPHGYAPQASMVSRMDQPTCRSIASGPRLGVVLPLWWSFGTSNQLQSREGHCVVAKLGTVLKRGLLAKEGKVTKPKGPQAQELPT